VAEQVHPAAVDGMLRLDGFDQEVEEGRAVVRHLPGAPIGRVRPDDDEALLRGDVAEQIDQRASVAA
jgi:hypothetical protein